MTALPSTKNMHKQAFKDFGSPMLKRELCKSRCWSQVIIARLVSSVDSKRCRRESCQGCKCLPSSFLLDAASPYERPLFSSVVFTTPWAAAVSLSAYYRDGVPPR